MENQENQEKKHKRRVRYSGTHPRNYKEKYKELNPEKYADTISKVIKKGGTPAGMHISICVNEILDFLTFSRDSRDWMQHWDTAVIRRRCWKNCRRRAYLWSGCRPDRIGEDKETTGRKGIRAGYPDGKA